jgi:hypothetical protein
VTLTNYVTGQDVLGFVAVPATMGNIVGSFNATTGVLTLTSTGATATKAQWQTALRSVTYVNTSEDPSSTARTVTFELNDGGGTSSPFVTTVTVAAVNDAPVLSGPSVLSYTENAAATVVNPVLTVADIDNTTLASATVTVTNYATGEDVLGLVSVPATMGNVTGLFDAGTGILTLTSIGNTATKAQWQAALRAVTYLNSSDNPSTVSRQVAFTVNDGLSSSNSVSTTINLTAVNDAPILSVTNVLNYIENSAAVSLNPQLVVADFDNTTLASGTVTLTTFISGQDQLGFVADAGTMGNITGTVTNGTVALASVGSTATKNPVHP